MSDCIINRKAAKCPQAVEPAPNRTEDEQNIKLNVKSFQLHSITGKTLTGKEKKKSRD